MEVTSSAAAANAAFAAAAAVVAVAVAVAVVTEDFSPSGSLSGSSQYAIISSRQRPKAPPPPAASKKADHSSPWHSRQTKCHTSSSRHGHARSTAKYNPSGTPPYLRRISAGSSWK